MQDNKNTLLIAGSIVVAGIIIALGIFLAPGATTDQQNNTQNAQNNSGAQTAQIDIEPITEEDYIRGNQGAAVKLVEFSDLECPFCQRFHDVMKQVTDQYSPDEVAWVFRHFPIEQLHSKAPTEAHAAECAAELGGEDAFWKFTDRVFEVSPGNNGLDLDKLPDIAEYAGLNRQAFVECQESDRHTEAVQADVQDARTAGGNGTPYNVIILENELTDDQRSTLEQMFAASREGQFVIGEDGKKIAISGAFPFEGMQQLLNVLLGKDSDSGSSS